MAKPTHLSKIAEELLEVVLAAVVGKISNKELEAVGDGFVGAARSSSGRGASLETWFND